MSKSTIISPPTGVAGGVAHAASHYNEPHPMNNEPQHMKQYSAIRVDAGSIRRITLEAENLEEARRLATQWGFGLEGEVHPEIGCPEEKVVHPDAFNSTDSRRKLGDISRTMLYRLLARKILCRLPGTRKILVTRTSIERYCARAA